jgi:hypothetical protein
VAPIVAVSRHYALAAHPWCRHFYVIVHKTGEVFRCSDHWSGITCLGLLGAFFVSGSAD